MIARRYETIVGVFVVASLLALLVMVLVIARQEGLFQEYVEYRSLFRNIGGLKVGSEVHLAGVTVGNVKEITISREGSIVVTFQVIKKYSDRVRADSQASIGFMGLLGEKSLDITAGSPKQPAVPPEGWLASVEPLDITQILAKAGPSLEDLQKILHNLAAMSGGLMKPGGDFSKILEQVKQIVTKINEGKGTLGLFVNDQTLYKELTGAVGGAKKVVGEVDKSFFGKETKEKTRQTLTNVSKAAGSLQEAATNLPGIMQKADSFLDNLSKAGKSLPQLINEAQTTVNDADLTAKAAQKSWLLRRYVPQPKEHTIRMEADPGKD